MSCWRPALACSPRHPRVGFIRAVARQLPTPVNVLFRTLDDWWTPPLSPLASKLKRRTPPVSAGGEGMGKATVGSAS